MKILQVNNVYNKGSTGKITHDIHEELLSRGYKSVVCYGRGKKVNEPYVYKTCGELYSKLNNLMSRISGIMYGGCFFSTNKLIGIIKKEKPDIVHLQCLNGYFVNIYRLLNWLKKNNIKTVLTLHAEFMYTGGCGHSLDCDKWSIETGCNRCPRLREETKSIFFDRTCAMWRNMKKAFEGFENLHIVCVSPWLAERAKRSQILKDKKLYVIFNGLNIDIFHPYETQDFRDKHNITDEKIIFHVTPFFSANSNHFKGGYYVIKLAQALKDDKVKVLVAGRYPKDIKVPSNVVLLGNLTSQENLARYYSLADVTLITSKRETFSMVVAESLCCGTPVAGFKAGGPEQIALCAHSSFVEYGDIEALKQEVKKMFELKRESEIIAKAARNIYSKNTMADKYVALYNQIISENNNA